MKLRGHGTVGYHGRRAVSAYFKRKVTGDRRPLISLLIPHLDPLRTDNFLSSHWHGGTLHSLAYSVTVTVIQPIVYTQYTHFCSCPSTDA